MTFRTIAVHLVGNKLNLSSVLHAAGAEVDQFGNRVDRSNDRVVRSNQRASQAWKQTAAATLLVAAAFGTVNAVIGGSAGFEQRLRNVNSITHATDAELRAIGDTALNLSRELPQSANVLAEGLYDIASSGFQGAEGLTVLEASAEAASAGLTTTANSAKAISAVLNAYGLSASSATDVSDSLFQTVNLGVVSFEELTGVIGDVVGTAAAAAVDINQVGAAVPTKTLSGVSAAEAGTSLNRVLQSLLQPSDALITVYERLGYESGQAALETKGLRGVMDDLREATGGNVTTLLQLFPEIRAARGALALMSDEGRTYAGVAGQIEDADARQGATKKALAEQLKAVSAQWQIFTNRAQAAAIEGGTRLLPIVLDLLNGVQSLAQQGLPILNAGLEALGPFFGNVRDIGIDVVEVLGTIAQAAAPVAAALLQIGAGAVIGGLNVLTDVLANLTGFVADNHQLVILLAAAYAATLLPSLAAAQVAFNRLILTPVVLGLVSMAGAAGTAAGGVSGLTAAMAGLVSIQAVATAGFAAIFGVLGLAAYSWTRAGQAADEFVRTTTEGFDALDQASSEKAIEELRKAGEAGIREGAKFEGAGGTWRAGWAAIFGDSDDITRKGAAASEAMLELERKVANAANNLADLSGQTGIAADELARLAQQQDIDLSKPAAQSGAELQKLIGYTQDLERQTGISTRQMADDIGLDIEGMQAFADAIDKAGKKVSTAFAGASDIISAFKPEEGAAAVEAANETLAKAEQRLSDVQTRQGGQKKRSASDDVTLAAARRDVAAATQEVQAAQEKAASGSFENTYKRLIQQADEFSDNLQAAAQRGLDPQFIARLLEKGPEAAAPVLQAIVSDHSGRLIELTNTSEEKLREISDRVVFFSRLTQTAIQAPTDALARDLGAAMRIAAANLETDGPRTAAAIAKAIGEPTAEVRRIAQAFGITIAEEVQKGIDANKPKITVGLGSIAPGKLAQIQRLDASRAQGGLLTGRGTPTSDSLVIAASTGEFVQRAAAVDYYGVEFMNKLNRMELPKFATGGVVGRPGGPSGATVVRIPVSETRTHQAPIYVDKVSTVARWADLEDEMDRRNRFNTSPDNLGG